MRAPIVLASKSLARRAILEGAGVPVALASADVDEAQEKMRLLARGATPREVAEALARLKAERASAGGEAFVIGADQTLEFEGGLYDKAETLEAARARLELLRGRSHELHSAVVVARAGQAVWAEIETATLTMRDFSDAFLDAYLALEGPAALGSVGCYRLEGPGAQLFSEIQGGYFAILGLPLLGLLAFLRREGALAS